MTRDVTVYFTNNLTNDITYNSRDIEHGKVRNGPNNIDAGAEDAEAFKVTKTTGSFYGVTGSVTYNLPDGSNLTIMFNNPYSREGSGSPNNCWIYGLITNVPAGGTAFYISDITGFDMDAGSPHNEEKMNVTFTISQIGVDTMIKPGTFIRSRLKSRLERSKYIRSKTTDTTTTAKFQCEIINDTDIGYITLQSMTHGDNSPPVDQGNPPVMKPTVPIGEKVEVIDAYGGYQMKDSGSYYYNTEGEVKYNLPDGSELTIYWKDKPGNKPEYSIGVSSGSQYKVDSVADDYTITATVSAANS